MLFPFNSCPPTHTSFYFPLPWTSSALYLLNPGSFLTLFLGYRYVAQQLEIRAVERKERKLIWFLSRLLLRSTSTRKSWKLLHKISTSSTTYFIHFTGEKLSEFLRNIENTLNGVVQRDGLPASAASGTCLSQLIKGATFDMMLLILNLRERRSKPPKLFQLLNEIYLEQGYEVSWYKFNKQQNQFK